MNYMTHNLNTFDNVVATYESITPIRCTKNNDNVDGFKDRRPLGMRRYWWERIVKISDNCYLLSDGSWARDDAEFHMQTAPIVWERKEDGDYLTVRSHMRGYISVSRYWFLSRNLPNGMDFEWH